MSSPSDDPVRMLIEAGAIPASPYGPYSRYRGVALALWTAPDGTQLPFGRRRFVPPRAELPAVALHTVTGGERPDHLAHRHYQQPLLQWRIGDANAVVDLFELTDTPGARLAVPEPPPAV